MSKSNATIAKFTQVLISKGLLSPAPALSKRIYSVEDVFALNEKWQEVAKAFVHKGRKVEVVMRFERTYHNESLVWPVISLK